MLVFCDGMPRSGSTWSFNVILRLLKLRRPSDKVYGGRGMQPVETLKALDSDVRHAVLKTHSLTPLSLTLVRLGAAKAVYTHRDFADSVASAMRAHDQSFRDVISVCKPGLGLFAFHRDTKTGVMVAYPELVRTPEKAIARIGEYLFGEPVPSKIIRQVAKATSFEQMRARSEQINAGKLRLIPTIGNAFDPETLLYRNHIGDGTSGYGQRLLNKRQLARIDSLIEKYGLPRYE